MFFICEHKMFTWTLSALSVFSVKVYVSFVSIICSRERDYFALWSCSSFVNIKCSREHYLLCVLGEGICFICEHNMFTWTWLYCLVVLFYICEHKMFTWTLSALSVFSVKVYVSRVNIICSRELDYFVLWSYSTFVNIKCSSKHFLLWVCSRWRYMFHLWT